jgi:hypothetical protein
MVFDLDLNTLVEDVPERNQEGPGYLLLIVQNSHFLCFSHQINHFLINFRLFIYVLLRIVKIDIGRIDSIK